MLKIDFHGYHPRTVEENDLVVDGIKQAWEMAEDSVVLIHGHAHGRAVSLPFANTNTRLSWIEDSGNPKT